MGWPYHNKPPMGWPLDYDSGLVPGAGFWLMNEGSGDKVFDLSGNGNNGTIVGGTNWVPGQFDSCILLDGDDNNLLIPSWTLELNSSVSMWFRLDAGADIDYRNALMGNDSFYLRFTSTTAFYPSWMVDFDVPTMSTEKWYFLVMTRDSGSFFRLYLNGIESSTGAKFDAQTLVVTEFGGGDPTANRDFTGKIDMPMCYNNHTLSAFEIAFLYQYPFCMFMNPDEIPVLDQYYDVGVGNAGIMTPWGGYWGPTF